MKKILLIFGTRPEAIKMAPLYYAFAKREDVDCKICVTAQHREMLDQVMDFFDLKADWDLNLMTKGQSLGDLTGKILTQVEPILHEFSPDWVIVQGDTTTSMAAALAAFYQKIRVCHVEAGLRTDHKWSPFPEEINRRISSVRADLHMAPTEKNRQALLSAGILDQQICVTGNTVIDALFLAKGQLSLSEPQRRKILITGHRRESFGKGFEQICSAIAELAVAYPECDFTYPVHLNPCVQEPVNRRLSGLKNVQLLEPLTYPEFVKQMAESTLILTDSGGVQEEAPSLGKPVLVMRDTTERQEGIDSGTAKLVGTNKETIIKAVRNLLDSKEAWNKMSMALNPYGDGKASERIVSKIMGLPDE